MDQRQLLRSVSAGRVAAGVALMVLPGTVAGRWIGPVASEPGAKVMIRAMGARDLAIGAGTLDALAAGRPVRAWALAGTVSDLGDALATVLALRSVGWRRGLPLIAVAAFAGATSYVAAEHLS